ncbi:MAG: YlmC/YmxH family sporulation protein [Acutalibacteraceae bacterium]|nr:YlmC/YmxH family sporulation protein [Acutalibacteraceae bacterium]
MICRVCELRHKEVINSKDGCRLGFVDDVEIDTVNANVISIVIYGKWRCFGLLGREEDIILKWDCIELIGEDTILVNYNIPVRKHNGFRGFFKK